ncbi:hypothetical protein DAMA08_002710 [Martiniozyma asiatica (nom. inval.)]|nr:hypothetical protein DAMA08_002710 [Martiniozyma asiatica]
MLAARRALSQSRCRSGLMDILQFYKKPAAKPTEEVMAEAAQKSQGETPSPKNELISSEVEIIGKLHPRFTDAKLQTELLNGFVVPTWMAEKQSVESIPEIVKNAFQLHKAELSAPLNDLSLRFKVIKQIQVDSGVSITDIALTQLSTLDELTQYVISKINDTSSEITPDAIELNPQDFAGTNVHVGSFVYESEKKKMWQKLVEDAKASEAAAVNSYKA